MTAQPLTELALRVEAAEAGSRELDAEIARLLDPTDDPRERSFLTGRDYPDTCTTSLDAALALVSEKLPDREISITSYSRNGRYVWEGEIEHRLPSGARQGWRSAEAATPALALIAALLRALSDTGSESDD